MRWRTGLENSRTKLTGGVPAIVDDSQALVLYIALAMVAVPMIIYGLYLAFFD